jgi:hypothetical protein
MMHNIEDRARHHALAAATFAHDAEGLTPLNGEVNPVNCPHNPFAREELDFQSRNFD